MKFQLVKPIKLLISALMITTLFCGLIQIGIITVFAQAPGMIVFITSDTTWTKAGSPPVLSGPVFVNNGVTLKIEPGTTVELNGYYMTVNGTLLAKGSISEKINIKNVEKIEFTPFSVGWNKQPEFGSRIEHATVECPVYSSLPLKITHSIISDEVTVGDSSSIIQSEIGGQITAERVLTLTGCRVSGGVSASDSSELKDNVIDGRVSVGQSSKIFDNTIYGSVSGSDSVVSNNNIFGGVYAKEITNNIIKGEIAEDGEASSYVKGTTIINNTILARVIAQDSDIISNNYIKGNYTELYSNLVHYTMFRGTIGRFLGAVDIRGGSPIISNNVIDGGITTSVSGSSPKILNNTLVNSGIHIPCQLSDDPADYSGGARVPTGGKGESVVICENTINGIIDVNSRHCEVSGNNVKEIKIKALSTNIVNNVVADGRGIRTLEYDAVIEGNYLSNNTQAISGSGQIKNNIIIDSRVGLSTGGNSVVQNNTIAHCDTAIQIGGDGSVTIEQNYLYDNTVGLYSVAKLLAQNNTIVKTEIAFKLHNHPSVTIRNNNIEDYKNFSIYVTNIEDNLDVSNNWWGTVEPQTINVSIRDYKYDLSLGKVNFVPFLTEQNPQTPIHYLTENTTVESPEPSGIATFLEVTINPTNVREYESVALAGTVYPSPPEGFSFENLFFSVIYPSGDKITLGPFMSDSNGVTGAVFIPPYAGTYTVFLEFPEQICDFSTVNENGTHLYLGSTSQHTAFYVLSSVPEADDTGKPVAFFTFSPKLVSVNETVTFDASSSYDVNGSITSYLWDFGDGTTGTGETTAHSYDLMGTYTITLTITDNEGLTATTTRTIVDVIPEFPSWLLLPLFLVTTFVVVAVRNKITGVSSTK